MIQFKFIPNKDFGQYTPVELNVDLPNDSTLDEILEYFKVFLKSMTFFDSQVESIKIVEDDENFPQTSDSDLCVGTQKKNFLNWRLPDIYELNLMYENLHLKGIGGLASEDYWSSSENYSYNAWFQYFSSGYQSIYYKDNSRRVRAVRAFKLQEGEKYRIGQETETGFVFDIQENTIFECKKEDEPKSMTWQEAMDKFGGM